MILIRATRVDDALRSMASDLVRASGHRVAMLLDEQRGPVDAGPFAKVSLTGERCRALGLYVPSDFAWRCGDYGLYLARRQYPDERSFWMIEYDVRIAAADRFFRIMDAHPEIDLLAADLAPATPDWWWYRTAAAADVPAFRCLFPVIRLTADAVDAGLAARVRHSRQFTRRGLWPNDEAFLATTIAAAGLSHADMNTLVPDLYDAQSFSYHHLFCAEDFTPDESRPRLFHPVLDRADHDRKASRSAREHGRPAPLAERAARKLFSRLNAHRRW